MVEVPTSAERAAAHHVQIFVPEVTRDEDPIPLGQQYWIDAWLELLGRSFGGATALPASKGVWYDVERDSLQAEQTVMVFSYADDNMFTDQVADMIGALMRRMGREGKQGAVGILIDNVYTSIEDYSEELDVTDGE